MNKNSDIIIVGGGLNGLTQALALADYRFKVIVIDAQPLPTHRDPEFDGRAYALALTSVRMLKLLGVWAAVADQAQPMNEIKVTDGRAGEGPSPWFMHFDHREAGEGPLGHMVEDRHIRHALLDAVAIHPNVEHIAGETVLNHIANETVSVTLSNGSQRTGKLVIGCDGRNSATAVRAGIKRNGWDYDQSAIVTAIAHEKPHHGIAHQFFMPTGPLAILPLKNDTSAIVWSQPHETARVLVTGPEAQFLDALRPAFGSFLGEISIRGKRFSYPLALSVAEEFTSDRMALVGDAAHGIHPIAGQGLNAGLRDIAALTEVLVAAKRRGEDIGTKAVLDRYVQWRRFDVTSLSAATDGFNRLFSNDNPILRGLRDFGMGAIGAMPKLRQNFIREAAGLTGDLPRLMQGKQI